MKILYRGKNLVDAGLIYGAFTVDQQAQFYRASVSRRDGIPIEELKFIDVRVDPQFHATQPEIIDNLGPS